MAGVEKWGCALAVGGINQEGAAAPATALVMVAAGKQPGWKGAGVLGSDLLCGGLVHG